MNNENNPVDSFNARHLTPQQVAAGFVPSSHFYELLGVDNCVLVGPRGSGKTTLLKMLQIQAAESWNASLPDVKISFIGLFVPADVRWAKQLTAKTEELTDRAKSLVQECAFGNSVNLALIDSLEYCINNSDKKSLANFAVFKDKKREAELVAKIAELWEIKLAVPSISGLKHGLRMSQMHLGKIALELFEGGELLELSKRCPFLTVPWLAALVNAIETINADAGCHDQVWALLLDELEIIPSDLLKTIISPLRSTSQNLIFKLALSPTGAGSSILSNFQSSDPTQGHDFKTVRLWYADLKRVRNFSQSLFISVLSRRGFKIGSSDDVAKLFGLSNSFEDDDDPDEPIKGTPVENSMPLIQREKLFSQLAKKDESFNSFLVSKELTPENLNPSDVDKNGPLIRKITPLVTLRNLMIKKWAFKDKPIIQSKKSPKPYMGVPNLFDITEGNPRWILNLLDDLINNARSGGLNLKSQGVQSAAISAFGKRFISMLKVYPVGKDDLSAGITLYSFVERIAQSLSQRLYKDSFSSDPALSFVVDKVTAKEYGDLIETCVHLGALVIANPEANDNTVLFPDGSGLEGARLRICYRLAPEFFLPLRLTRSINMSTLLSSSKIDDAREIASCEVKDIAQLEPKQLRLL